MCKCHESCQNSHGKLAPPLARAFTSSLTNTAPSFLPDGRVERTNEGSRGGGGAQAQTNEACVCVRRSVFLSLSMVVALSFPLEREPASSSPPRLFLPFRPRLRARALPLPEIPDNFLFITNMRAFGGSAAASAPLVWRPTMRKILPRYFQNSSSSLAFALAPYVPRSRAGPGVKNHSRFKAFASDGFHAKKKRRKSFCESGSVECEPRLAGPSFANVSAPEKLLMSEISPVMISSRSGSFGPFRSLRQDLSALQRAEGGQEEDARQEEDAQSGE